MRRHRHAKIVATVGPASHTPERLKALFLAGVDTFRLNFSHGTHDDHAKVHAAIRALEQETGRPIGILQDLQGPKIRIGTLRGGKAALATGDRIRFVREGREGGPDAIPLPHPEIFAAVAPARNCSSTTAGSGCGWWASTTRRSTPTWWWAGRSPTARA